MSVARPARSLVGRCLVSTRTTPVVSYHAFHTSSPCSRRLKSRFRNVTAEDMGLLDSKTRTKTKKMAQYIDENFPEYSKEELAQLKQTYSPDQMQALKAAEKAIDPEHLVVQGRFRDDPFAPDYVEDYTVLNPKYDLKPDLGGTPQEPEWLGYNEWMDDYAMKMSSLLDKKTDDQLTRAMVRALRSVKLSAGQDMIDLTEEELDAMENDPDLAKKYVLKEGEPIDEVDANASGPEFMTRAQAMKLDEAVEAAWKKELDKLASAADMTPDIEPTSLELNEGGPAGEIRLHTAEAVELGKVPGVEGLYKAQADPDDEGHDDGGEWQEIKRLLGMPLKDIMSLVRKVLVRRVVVNQTRLGKIRSHSVLAIAGNGNGRLGLGIAKSTEPRIASETAQMLAIRNMKPIRRYENRTIFGNVTAKVSGSVVELSARPAGFGLRCPHRIFEMCRASGIHDLAVKMPRSKSPLNTVKAAYQALTNQIDPEEIAIGRGKKLVDARKVYYGGAVH
ncbi:37S ribosomal protein S5 [Paramyrothecium foliicola]|nr:37S ribosomal protein S5 [Paramyrothecium foliicola]